MTFTVDIRPENQGIAFDDWGSAITYTPSNINYVFRDGSEDAGSIQFDIPLSDPNLTANQFGPWRSEWRLSRDGDKITQGIIIKTSPVVNDRVQVGGEDYLTYLKHRVYPYDYTTYETALEGSIPFFLGIGYDSAGLITHLIDALNNYSDYPRGSGISYTLPFTVNTVGTFEPILSYPILPGDSTWIADHISAIAGQDGSIGFEYYVDTNDAGPVLELFANYYNTPPSNYVTITDDMVVGDPQWSNNGPASTREIGFGLGSVISGESVYLPSMQRYRWLDNLQLYGDAYKSQDQVQALVDAWGKFDRSPQHDFTLTVQADLITPLSSVVTEEGFAGQFYKEHGGVVLALDSADFEPFHPIGTTDEPFYYRATELNFNLSNEGDLLCELTMQQCYIADQTDD